jgi:hypothetical protein
VSDIPTPTKQEVRAALWERGILQWKLHPVQKQMYDIFLAAAPNSILVWLLARQTGKSYCLTVIACEQALKKPKSIIKLLTDTKLHVESIFIPLFDHVLEDCPEHLKPHYHKNKYVYMFPNGSQIQLAGSDNGHYERLRGQKTDLVLVDEAGFCSKLNDIVKSVLLPTTTHTGGKIILASTPSEDPYHEFNGFIEEAELNGNLVKKTIYENPLLKKEQIDNIIKQMGGVTNTKFRREYLVEIIRDETNVVFPEFNDERQGRIVSEWDKPVHYDAYVGMDLGGTKDLTAIIYMYYDFINDKVVVEDEIIVDHSKMTIPELTAAAVAKEIELYTNILTNEFNEPKMRVSDINEIATQEIYRQSENKLYFRKAQKDDKKMAVNMLRTLIQQEKLVINPKCETLIRHLGNCKWKRSRSSDVTVFGRSPDNGHYDAVDALIYGIRSINFQRNPYPAGWDMNLSRENTFIRNPDVFSSTSGGNPVTVFKKIFNKKS